ncbi:hypothetical protein LBMAG53_10440 [Planctomycetota bacterium]|nr:hypothetical protein LBMAG53_10440 [Planctomycetota bacterium]
MNPSLPSTKQYLEVLELEFEGDSPKVARVNMEFNDQAASVWFHVKDERFFIIINVSKKPGNEVCFARTGSANRVYLTAISEQYTYDQLARRTTLSPLTGWSMGDGNKAGKCVRKFSRISYEPLTNEAYELEEKLLSLLRHLDDHREKIAGLFDVLEPRIQICRHQYVDGNAGMHLRRETIDLLSSLKLDLDIDTYITGKPLVDSPERDF